MQDQPDQTTVSMRNDPDALIMSEARDATAIDDLEGAGKRMCSRAVDRKRVALGKRAWEVC